MSTATNADGDGDADADASPLDLPGAESTYREANGVRLHVVAAGDPGDPLVVLLHGFPDFWYGWRHQLPALVDAGYRVLVPDQRGYNRSDKPSGLDPYRARHLSADVAALIESEGRASAHLVGHDWGGMVACETALRRPGRVDRLAVLNAPHPTVFRRTLRSNPRQLLRSWYVFYLQVPRLPEWHLARDGASAAVSVLEAGARPGALTDAELARYRRAWQRDGATRGAVNWYRAAARRPDVPPRERIAAPTTVIWGDRDDALVPELADDTLAYCEDGTLDRFPAASHWVHWEEPDAVTDLLLAHLG